MEDATPSPEDTDRALFEVYEMDEFSMSHSFSFSMSFSLPAESVFPFKANLSSEQNVGRGPEIGDLHTDSPRSSEGPAVSSDPVLWNNRTAADAGPASDSKAQRGHAKDNTNNPDVTSSQQDDPTSRADESKVVATAAASLAVALGVFVASFAIGLTVRRIYAEPPSTVVINDWSVATTALMDSTVGTSTAGADAEDSV